MLALLSLSFCHVIDKIGATKFFMQCVWKKFINSLLSDTLAVTCKFFGSRGAQRTAVKLKIQEDWGLGSQMICLIIVLMRRLLLLLS